MVRLEPAEYLGLLLKAHSAEDALDPQDLPDPPTPGTPPPEEPAVPNLPLPALPLPDAPIDLGPVLGLLATAEGVAGLSPAVAGSAIDEALRHAAAAA